MQASYFDMSSPTPFARSASTGRGRLVASPFHRSWFWKITSCISQNFPWSLAHAAASDASQVFRCIGSGKSM